MKILFLTQVLPYPLIGGAKIRAYYLLRYLAISHDLTLLSFTRDDDKQDDINHLEELCEAVYTIPLKRSLLKNAVSFFKSFLQDTPLIILRDQIPAMEVKINELMSQGEFDIIHADQTSMAYYALFARTVSRQKKPPAILLDQHNALFKVVERQAKFERSFFMKYLWQREAAKLARYESQLIQEFDEVLTVTAEDRNTLLALMPQKIAETKKSHITELPICIDALLESKIDWSSNMPQILHLGTMFWPPNIEGVMWFANEVLPRIIEEVPDVKFIIAGKNPPRTIRDLEAEDSPLKDHLRVTGFVADPVPLISSSKVFIVPLLAGGGMRVKILDAWQWGLPIVSTTIGAEGIHYLDGENIFLADDPETFADNVIKLLRRPDLAMKMGEYGREWVARHYDWRQIYPRINHVIDRFQD